MTDITQPLGFQDRTGRQADAVEEIRQLHRDHEILQAQLAQYRHSVGQLQFRVEYLSDQLHTAQQNERVAFRKLVRLASAMTNMSTLAKEADEIMRSVSDWHADETEQQTQAEQESAAQAVASLPARESDADPA